ncbi:hypothetical protein ACP70R_038851 [Stipagrostis hirtigluma subsp. patula]
MPEQTVQPTAHTASSSSPPFLFHASPQTLTAAPKTLISKQRGGEKGRSGLEFGALAPPCKPCGRNISTGEYFGGWMILVYSAVALLEFVVKPGETVKNDPGEFYCVVSQIALQGGNVNENVEVFAQVDGKRLLIGTLSVDGHPQYATELVFEKEFELLHTSITSEISMLESDKSKETKGGAEKLAATESSKPPAVILDFRDEDHGESSDKDEEGSPKNTKGKNRPAEKPLKTPQEKKAKAATPLKTPPGKKA